MINYCHECEEHICGKCLKRDALEQEWENSQMSARRIMVAVKGARAFLMAIQSDEPSPMSHQMQKEIYRLTKVIEGGKYDHHSFGNKE